MAEEQEYDLRIPPGTPDMEILLSEVKRKFNLKVISPKDLNDPYYIALRGDFESVKAAKEYIRKRLEEIIAGLERRQRDRMKL